MKKFLVKYIDIRSYIDIWLDKFSIEMKVGMTARIKNNPYSKLFSINIFNASGVLNTADTIFD